MFIYIIIAREFIGLPAEELTRRNRGGENFTTTNLQDPLFHRQTNNHIQSESLLLLLRVPLCLVLVAPLTPTAFADDDGHYFRPIALSNIHKCLPLTSIVPRNVSQVDSFSLLHSSRMG